MKELSFFSMHGLRTMLVVLLILTGVISADAVKFTYQFGGIPVTEAIVRISKDHPDVNISFIYTELENYRTSAVVRADDPYEALHQAVGLNPISVIKNNDRYYLEAMQRGKYCYSGRVVDKDSEPVAAATVMLLAPADSTVITYGVTDDAGRFVIPCDRRDVIGKLSCVGYSTVLRRFPDFAVGTVLMPDKVIALDAVSVETDNAYLYSDKSVYLPTARQKNASQTALDLIARMAIPQLRAGEDIQTISGQPVTIYIDYAPATENELTGMRVTDVRSVEYYDYPSDPRFQGNSHVINFIMQKYEYGGYVKGIYYDNFVISRQANGYAKIQYKNMTYDWAGGAFYRDDRKDYENTDETFRLPQADGSVTELSRKSVVEKSKKRKDIFWTSFKALYRTDDVTLSNMLTADFERTPEEYTAGKVTYLPAEFSASDYVTRNSGRINSLVYSGYWFVKLPHGNSMTFNPYYAYSHTNQSTAYEETGIDAIRNSAVDDSHQMTGDLAFVRPFGNAGTLKAMCQGYFLQNRTRYSGTSTTSDKARTYRLGPGINYSYSDDRLYANFGLGLYWDKSVYGDIRETSTSLWTKLALQYAFNPKNSVSADFDYRKWAPRPSYRSASVVKSDPLISYTGNPSLVPFNSFQINLDYTFIPNNRYSFSVYGFAWIVDNRYAYDYEANATGILRTIKQPMGSYAQIQYGVQAAAKQFDDKLQIQVSLYLDHVHNGMPYNWTKTKMQGTVSAYYYLGKVYFGATYCSPGGYADGCMVGTWMKPRSSYTFQVGWSDRNWNLRFFTRNFLRYGTYQTEGIMENLYYDSTSYLYGGSYAGFFQISATYTFSFGKKVKVGNEAYQASGASSGILK